MINSYPANMENMVSS